MKKTLYYTIQYLKDKDDYVEENGIKYKRLFIQNNEVSNLLDYITNLEKSNARLKEENKELTEKIEFYQRKTQRLEKRNKEIYEGFMVTTQELCDKSKEIERLNNIFDELEQYTNDRIEYCYGSGCLLEEFNIYNDYNELIQELKEGK